VGSLHTDQKFEQASWFDLLKRSLKEVLRIDRSQLTASPGQEAGKIMGIRAPIYTTIDQKGSSPGIPAS